MRPMMRLFSFFLCLWPACLQKLKHTLCLLVFFVPCFCFLLALFAYVLYSSSAPCVKRRRRGITWARERRATQ